ncbi:MAG: hypothetical protein ACTHMB_15265 [Candidatus Binatia bacterium]
MFEERITRREIIKKAAYVAPLIFTIPARFSFASAGSGDYYIGTTEKDKNNQGNKDKKDYKNSFLDLTNKTRIK